ncbi:MAG: aminopeptidase [Verrucomicrobia bacterium]|nr:aminopeptidase [Verrucomicrobiota bacterium]
MHDPRIDQLASQLVNYSTSVRKGEKVLIDLYDTPSEVGVALIRATREAKAMPFVNINDSRISREMLVGATDRQYQVHGDNLLRQMKGMDAYIAVRGSHNINESSDVPGVKMKTAMKRLRPVQDYRVRKTRWVVLRWPTSSMAQQASMSTEAFEDFFFRVCLLDYEKLLPAMRALKQLTDQTSDVHILGEGTDLKFSIKGLRSYVCGGEKNIPDGEVFTAPVKDSVEGVLSYNAPTIYQGIAFDQIKLEFSKGKIVKATSNDTKAINRILNSDPGARFIGEFALGFHPEIRHPMRDILFDEKIAGSFHFTPGQAYEGEADNGNRSQVHWDMVCIQRPDYGGGEIYFDGKLIRKDGQFLAKKLAPLNS